LRRWALFLPAFNRFLSSAFYLLLRAKNASFLPLLTKNAPKIAVQKNVTN
jgi:hypothetical protein